MNGFHLMKLSFDLKYALQYSVVNGLFSMDFFAKEASARFHENGFRSNGSSICRGISIQMLAGENSTGILIRLTAGKRIYA